MPETLQNKKFSGREKLGAEEFDQRKAEGRGQRAEGKPSADRKDVRRALRLRLEASTVSAQPNRAQPNVEPEQGYQAPTELSFSGLYKRRGLNPILPPASCLLPSAFSTRLNPKKRSRSILIGLSLSIIAIGNYN
ncbi:MAG TPA: hypothetical protein V6D30_07830 [Leptolyngbyaceae cyanobacterium]